MRWGVAALLVAGSVVAAEPVQAANKCGVWRERTVAYSLGILESLLPDNRGGMLLSASKGVERLTPNGEVKLLAKVPSPGQIVWWNKHSVMFPTGDALASGALSRADGTLQILNLKTHKLRTYATGLTMPNGLALDRDRTAYVTRDTGAGTGITRISARPGHTVTTNWSRLSDTNGIAIDTKRRVMYVDRTFELNAPIMRIPMAHPNRATKIGDLAGVRKFGLKLLDDMFMSDGLLYVPANGGGELFSFDPLSKQVCLITSTLGNPSHVTVGTGHGWRKGALYVCGFDGTVREYVRT
jgi:sugar lactone lactonase YvrE